MEQKFKKESDAIAAVEALVNDYKQATYLEKAPILSKMESLKKDIPEEYKEAHHLVDRYVAMTPVTAMRRAQNLVHRFESAPGVVFNLRKEAKSMLEGIPKTPEYESVRDLLRHYANCGD